MILTNNFGYKCLTILFFQVGWTQFRITTSFLCEGKFRKGQKHREVILLSIRRLSLEKDLFHCLFENGVKSTWMQHLGGTRKHLVTRRETGGKITFKTSPVFSVTSQTEGLVYVFQNKQACLREVFD